MKLTLKIWRQKNPKEQGKFVLYAMDKVDPENFRRNMGMLSVVAYVLADMDGRLAGRKGAGE